MSAHPHTQHHRTHHLEESEDLTHIHDVQTLLSWHAPGRPFQKRSSEYFRNILTMMLLLEIILFFFSQYLLMAVVFALVFLAYALASVPPHNFFYKISTEGVMVENHFFLWQELYDFFFNEQNGEKLLHIRTKAYYPGEIMLTLGEIHPEHVKTVLLPYLPYREYVEPTFMEKSGEWLAKTFPLEQPAKRR